MIQHLKFSMTQQNPSQIIVAGIDTPTFLRVWNDGQGKLRLTTSSSNLVLFLESGRETGELPVKANEYARLEIADQSATAAGRYAVSPWRSLGAGEQKVGLTATAIDTSSTGISRLIVLSGGAGAVAFLTPWGTAGWDSSITILEGCTLLCHVPHNHEAKVIARDLAQTVKWQSYAYGGSQKV